MLTVIGWSLTLVIVASSLFFVVLLSTCILGICGVIK
jgi:hypothetical protein